MIVHVIWERKNDKLDKSKKNQVKECTHIHTSGDLRTAEICIIFSVLPINDVIVVHRHSALVLKITNPIAAHPGIVEVGVICNGNRLPAVLAGAAPGVTSTCPAVGGNGLGHLPKVVAYQKVHAETTMPMIRVAFHAPQRNMGRADFALGLAATIRSKRIVKKQAVEVIRLAVADKGVAIG